MNKYFKCDYYRMIGEKWNPVKGTSCKNYKERKCNR